MGVYFSALRRNCHERSERSLELTNDAAAADRVLIFVTVTGVDPGAQQLTALIRFQLVGNIAENAATPNVDLRFLVNNTLGQRVFDFSKGERVSSIEVTLPMRGDVNRYPFDRYETNLWLLMDMPEASKRPKAPVIPPASRPSSATPSAPATSPMSARLPAPATSSSPPIASRAATLAAGSNPPAELATLDDRRVPLSISVSASTPGLKYTGEVIQGKQIAATRVLLKLKRSYNVVTVSITVMCLMMGIALSIVAMVLKAIVSRGEKLDVLPLSLCIGLIFGLPALRNIQPGVPPVGALGDYFSFVWAEIFVAPRRSLWR
jgi:hypothetical protein